MLVLLLGFGIFLSVVSMLVVMKCVEEYGCVNSIVCFIIFMGININWDGVVLYEVVLVMFIC